MLSWFTFFALAGCVSQHTKAPGPTAQAEPATNAMIASAQADGIAAIVCETADLCTIETAIGQQTFDPKSGDLTAVNGEITSPSEPWPPNPSPAALEDLWNQQINNQWRSPFRAQVPSPNGGRLRIQRGLTPGTSRVVRLGGSVLTARQAPDPGHVAYPNALALHPTGAEVYLIVWPNPHLIAFNARTLETTWRIGLGGPAQGLFVSEDGRYLVAEIDGVSPEHQMLDYEPQPRVTPEATDPSADQFYQWLNRPNASGTVLVDLGSGRVAARLNGSFVGLSIHKQGAVVATDSIIASVEHMATTSSQ